MKHAIAILLILAATPAAAEMMTGKDLCNLKDPGQQCSWSSTKSVFDATLTITGPMTKDDAEQVCYEMTAVVSGLIRNGAVLDPPNWTLFVRSSKGGILASCPL